jgi:hypothetical protein
MMGVASVARRLPFDPPGDDRRFGLRCWTRDPRSSRLPVGPTSCLTEPGLRASGPGFRPLVFQNPRARI